MYDAPSSSRTYSAYLTDDSWTETGITWNNKPSTSTKQGSTTTGTFNNKWLSWDVTNAAKAEFAGDKTLSIMIGDSNEGSSGMTTYFYSKEYSDASYRPYLEITYSGGTTTTTIPITTTTTISPTTTTIPTSNIIASDQRAESDGSCSSEMVDCATITNYGAGSYDSGCWWEFNLSSLTGTAIDSAEIYLRANFCIEDCEAADPLYFYHFYNGHCEVNSMNPTDNVPSGYDFTRDPSGTAYVWYGFDIKSMIQEAVTAGEPTIYIYVTSEDVDIDGYRTWYTGYLNDYDPYLIVNGGSTTTTTTSTTTTSSTTTTIPATDIAITSFSCIPIGNHRVQCNVGVINLNPSDIYYIFVGGSSGTDNPAAGATVNYGIDGTITVVVSAPVSDTYELGAWVFSGTNPVITGTALASWSGDPVKIAIS